MEKRFLYLDGELVRKYLTPEEVIGVVKDLWQNWRKGGIIEGEHAFLPAGCSEDNVFLHIPACLTDKGVLGFKWINCYMNPAKGYPFSHGNIVVLNDIDTGSLKAIVSATDITAMRTAGGHGVAAARYLTRRPLKRLAVIGSGSQAVYGIKGFLCEFPEIEEIRISCRRRESFEKIEDIFKNRVNIQYREYQEIGKGADVILAATSSPDILLKYEYIEKGTTVIALDGFVDVDPRLAYLADKWFVGNRKTDGMEIIDSGSMSHGFALDYKNIYGEIVDVAGGTLKGRESDEEIIVYTHMGSGAYDVACANLVYEKALRKQDGIQLAVD